MSLPLQDKLPEDIACPFPYMLNVLRILLVLPLQDKLPKDIAYFFPYRINFLRILLVLESLSCKGKTSNILRKFIL
jgi:hypothetical protein